MYLGWQIESLLISLVGPIYPIKLIRVSPPHERAHIATYVPNSHRNEHACFPTTSTCKKNNSTILSFAYFVSHNVRAFLNWPTVNRFRGCWFSSKEQKRDQDQHRAKTGHGLTRLTSTCFLHTCTSFEVWNMKKNGGKTYQFTLTPVITNSLGQNLPKFSWLFRDSESASK